jgi:hypothetical protein
MKLLNIEMPVTINFTPQILLNVQDFYFYKVGYTSYDEGIFRQTITKQFTGLSSFHWTHSATLTVGKTDNYNKFNQIEM